MWRSLVRNVDECCELDKNWGDSRHFVISFKLKQFYYCSSWCVFGDVVNICYMTEENMLVCFVVWTGRYVSEIMAVSVCLLLGDVVSLLVGHWTCDLQVAGSSLDWAPLRSGLGQATYTCMPLSPSSIIWYQPKGVIFLAGKVTAGLVKYNGSLPLGLWLMSPVGWLSGNQDQLHAQCS